MRRPLASELVALVLCAVAVAPLVAQSDTLTLDEAVRLAIANNRDLALAAREVDRAAAQVEAARANRLPRLNVSFLDPVLFTDLDLRLGPLGALPLPHNFAFAVGTAAQPLSQLHDISLGIKASGLTRDLAAERLRGARQTVIDEVKRAYYGCLRAESGLKPTREAVTLFAEIERVVGAQVDEGAALESDRLEAQVRRAKQEHEVIVLEDTLATGRERLNVALARDADAPIAFVPVPAALPAEADLVGTKARLLDARPEVREARIALDLARVDVSLKQAEQLPRVSALFSYVGSINMPLLPGSIAAAVVQASWEPFDWGRKGREIAAKRLAVEQAELRLRQLEAAVTVDLNARARTLREARALVTVTELAGRAARERLRVVMDKYAEKAVLTTDLLQAQLAVVDADHDYRAALLAYWEARADFEKAAGVDQ